MEKSGDGLMSSSVGSSEEIGDSETDFGEYLSSQYELLERTLSFLNVTNLLNASLVCKSWNVMVQHIFRKREKNYKFYWHILSKKTRFYPSHYLKDNINFKSQFVLGFQVPHGKNMVLKELMEIRSTDSRMVIPGLFGDSYIVDSDILITPSCLNDGSLKYLRNEAAAIFFPKITGCKVIALSIQEDTDLIEFAQKLQCDKYGPLKGVLIFSGNVELDKEQKLFDIISDNAQLEPFALAGGVFPNVKQFTSNNWIIKEGLLNVCFYGENVNCYSDILQSQKLLIEPFMKNMKNNLKEIDLKKQHRIAFIIRCNGRHYGVYENELFHKYFPCTPAFVMVSYGECGFRAHTDNYHPEKKMKMNKNILYSFSTVYFFVTINLTN